MSKLDRWIDNKIVQNGFIWFFLFLILLTAIQAENRVSSSIFALLLLAPPVYINNLFLLKFLRKNLLLFIGLFILNTLVFTAISVFAIKMVAFQELELWMFLNFFGILFLALVFASAIKIARDSFTRRQQEKEAELKLLKAQLNPHFLFNTLNNLYGLSVVKSDKLPNLMLKLSNLLRYSLYETKETFVPLAKEITYLENYMALERIRLEDATNIQFESSGNLSSKQIAPMLFIVFVENAFKHLSISKDKKSEVIVSLHEENDRLIFKCLNTKDTTNLEHDNIEKGKSGIGLQNVKKRLTLMYPETHELTITENDASYSIQLILDL